MTVKNDLFNPKTIKRLCSDVKISTAQKKAANDWLKLLESGQLEKEKQNYFKFGLIILKDLLGYPVKEEMGYEEGNVEFTFANKEGKKIVCFEAKGTKTKDLFAPQHRDKKEHSTPVKQTWDYMGTLNLDYGIATNYEQFVLIDKSKGTSKYHIFDFKDVKSNEEKLKEFIAIFSKNSIIDNKFVSTLYDQSIIEEKEFTKQFYKLFHETRLMLIKEFQSNGEINRDEAIHYAQLFLNRMIFIFFAEDTGKVPQRLIRDQMLKVLDAVPVSEHSRYACDTIYSLFEGLDKGASMPVEIFGFNGGLFQNKIPPRFYVKDLTEPGFFKKEYQNSELKKKVKLDEFAEKIIKKYKNRINPIITNLLYMSSFDFNTELNVNILGHIFEQSLTDLEHLKGETPTKRKREGIFYTPEYVTDHICRTTIIPYLSEKRSSTVEDLIQEYSTDISKLEEKFRNIKILDPACGSGAFLLKAVDVLLEIHKEIQTFKEFKGQYSISLKGKKHKKITEQFTLTKWNEESEARKIIESNIFGVDINEESVEITKLSLFLKIASAGKKLIDLSENIKTGNSIVNDQTIDPKAFNWKTNFSDVFKKGGFDVVIGNPPYVVLNPETLNDYKFVKGNYNTYVAFIEKVIELAKPNGKISLIVPTTWLSGNNFEALRKELLFNNSLIEIIQLPYDIFEAYIDTVIVGIDKQKITPNLVKTFKYNIRDKADEKPIDDYILIDSSKWEKNPNHNIMIDTTLDSIYQKYRSQKSVKLGTISKVNRGTLPPKKDNIYTSKKDDNFIEWFDGQIYRYIVTKGRKFFVEYDRLLENKPMELFTSKKIMARQLVSRQFRLQFAYFDKIYAFKKNLYAIYMIDEKYDSYFLIAILNSKLFSFVHVKANVSVQRDDFPSFSLGDFRNFLIPDIAPSDQKELAKKAKEITVLRSKFITNLEKIHNRLRTVLKIEKIGNKLYDLHLLTFEEFLKESSKRSSIKMTLKEQDEWEDYFNDYKNELCDIDEKIKSVEHEIDQIVYRMYGLTKSEINTIEETLKK